MNLNEEFHRPGIKLGIREPLPHSEEWRKNIFANLWTHQCQVITALLRGQGISHPLTINEIGRLQMADLSNHGDYQIKVRNQNSAIIDPYKKEALIKVRSRSELATEIRDLLQVRSRLKSIERDPESTSLFLNRRGDSLLEVRQSNRIASDGVFPVFLALRDTLIEGLCRDYKIGFGDIVRLTVGSIQNQQITLTDGKQVKLVGGTTSEINESLHDLCKLATRVYQILRNECSMPQNAEQMPLFWNSTGRPIDCSLVTSDWQEPSLPSNFGHKTA